MDRAVFFDANALVLNSKDVSEYVAESIRNIYGIALEVSLKDYKGMTSKALARSLLLSHGVDEHEIEARLDRYIEDLPYSYYNVAWSDKVLVAAGAKELLQELKKRGIILGIVSGDAERVLRDKLKNTGISEYFDVWSSGDVYEDMAGIIKSALDAASEQGMESGKAVSVSDSARVIAAFKSAGVYTIGIEGDDESKSADLKLRSLAERDKVINAVSGL